MALKTTIGLVAAVIILIIFYVKRVFSFWDRLNVPNIKPQIPHGNFKGMGTKYFQGEMTQKFYNEMKGSGKFCGIYMFQKPMVLVLDLQLAKNILVKDFSYFHDRGLYRHDKDPLSGHLFLIEGQKWRNLRAKLTPTFTSGKMKYMYPSILAKAAELQNTLQALLLSDDSLDVEVKDLLARYTTDVIGYTAFGIECNSLKDPNAEFRRMGRLVFEKKRNNLFKVLLIHTSHKLARFFGIKSTLAEVEKFFLGIVRETVEYRESNNISRNDFMDLLIRIKNGQKSNKNDTENMGFTLTELAAQAYVFFIGAFESSSTVMTFTLYELALNKDIQKRAREEIKNELNRNEGQLSYEAMTNLSFTGHILNGMIAHHLLVIVLKTFDNILETLRKYPPVGNLMRKASKDYHVSNTNNIIPKGTSVWIPVHAIHHDEEYYPNPNQFDPDRFSSDEMNKRDNKSFLAFGDGPRSCIGVRFGVLQAKVGLVMLLSKFEVSLCSKSKVPLQMDNKNFILTPAGGMWLNLKRI